MRCVFRRIYLNFTLFGCLAVLSGTGQYGYFDGTREIAGFRRKVRWGVDKSLARPGRKLTTATKFWFYSTHSPRSSIQFLARCCNLCKPLKKKIGRFSVQPGLRGSNDLRVGRKIATFQLFFQPREQVVVRRGQIRRIG